MLSPNALDPICEVVFNFCLPNRHYLMNQFLCPFFLFELEFFLLGVHSSYIVWIDLQVIKYESVIHEFDPYFNYRVTQVGSSQIAFNYS